MNITIKTIAHAEHRYETCGDWWFDEAGNLEIRVSDMGDWRKEALVAFHELAEVLMCKHRNISQESVDAFDKAFEAKREEGNTDEPGDQVDAPYHREHVFAENLECLLMGQLDVERDDYLDALDAL